MKRASVHSDPNELLNAFDLYLSAGMASAVRVYPWHEQFLKQHEGMTFREVEKELLSPGFTKKVLLGLKDKNKSRVKGISSSGIKKRKAKVAAKRTYGTAKSTYGKRTIKAAAQR